jgi:hypothetical protein
MRILLPGREKRLQTVQAGKKTKSIIALQQLLPDLSEQRSLRMAQYCNAILTPQGMPILATGREYG